MDWLYEFLPREEPGYAVIILLLMALVIVGAVSLMVVSLVRREPPRL